jgi:CBS domain containing-hemolysin-like protein
MVEYELTDFQLKQKLEGRNDRRSQLLRKLHKNLKYVKRQHQFELILAFALGVTLFTQLITPPITGLVWCLGLTLGLATLRRISLVKKYSHQLFETLLEVIIKVSNWFKPLWWLVGLPKKNNQLLPTSEYELKDLIEKTISVSKEDRERLSHVLEANHKTAKDIMTQRGKVAHVAQSSTLGPILLAELEKSGHRYFPVFTKNEEVVGILNLRAVSDVGTAKGFGKVSDIMEEDLVWVPDDMPVYEVAKMFLSAKQYVLLVQNEQFEFAGIITIADLLKHTIAIV